MFELEKTFTFEAGHVLCHHDGKCSQPHGHSYVLVITVRGDELQVDGPKKNMLVDFADMSHAVKEMVQKFLDHRWLNDSLGTDSPTAEFIAKWIYDHLKPKLPCLYAITLYETATSKAKYCPSL